MTDDQTQDPPKAKSAKTGQGELTPLLRQYQQIKTEHPDHVLFFRCGDFYEMFFDDARTCSELRTKKTGRHPIVQLLVSRLGMSN